jgi:PEP-CTERM motif
MRTRRRRLLVLQRTAPTNERRAVPDLLVVSWLNEQHGSKERRMTRITSFVACMGLFFLGFAPRASAEPIRVTGGRIVVTSPAEGTVSIVGTRGFSLTGIVDPGEGRVDPFTECNPCLPGTSMLSVGASLGGTAFPNAVATLDGNTYTVGMGIDDLEIVALELFGAASLPRLSDSRTMVAAPFTAEGGFFLPGLSVPIRGRGIATVGLKPFPAGSPETWEIDRLVRYDFSDPVPEPATFILVASGLAGIVGARKKRRGRRANLSPSSLGG